MEAEMSFVLHVEGLTLRVSSHIINDAEVFRLVFSDKRPPLTITETFIGSKISRHDFWTSLPQGRQKEAEFFGRKINHHLKK